MTNEEMIRALEKYDTPTITNVIATYPKDPLCLGLYNPWEVNWYTDQDVKCMYPELGPRAGYAVTVVYGLPTPGADTLSFDDVIRALDASLKPSVLIIKQDFPENIKKKCGLSGGNMTTAFKKMGVVGVISDGPSRDIDEIRPMKVQYLLTGVTPGHGNFAIKAINVPVSVCSMDAAPGEIIHMDENGAVKFPAAVLPKVLENAEKLQAIETRRQKLMREAENAETVMRAMKGELDEE